MDNLDKGYLMEERLRSYFLDLGFFVVRGIKFSFEGFEITDVDLWLYNRPSSITRERIIVDIKNKKTPQAIERIFWTKGLMDALKLNDCLVATTEKRESVREFGLKNGVTVLDGQFLSKLREPKQERLNEEEFLSLIRQAEDPKFKDDWRRKIEISKTILLSQMDYSGCNILLSNIKYFFEQCIVNKLKATEACRATYLLLSHLLIIVDFILKDLAFLEPNDRAQRIAEGFKFGSLGKSGLERTLDLAVKISGQSNVVRNNFLKLYDSIPVDILKDYFSKNDNTKKLFTQAKNLENHTYSRVFTNPNNIDSELKGLISLVLDFHSIERNKFFNAFTGSSSSVVSGLTVS
ncbi:MAG: hypothetical protein ACOYXA_13195 [Bacteroidota bacterium]